MGKVIGNEKILLYIRLDWLLYIIDPFAFECLFIVTRRIYDSDRNNGEFCFITYNLFFLKKIDRIKTKTNTSLPFLLYQIHQYCRITLMIANFHPSGKDILSSLHDRYFLPCCSDCLVRDIVVKQCSYWLLVLGSTTTATEPDVFRIGNRYTLNTHT